MFVCPRCNQPLVKTRTKKGFVFVCRGCRGRSVAFSVVKKLARPEHAKSLWLQAGQHDAARGQRCPICRKAMREVPVPVEGRELSLDVCRSCQFIWFDPSELERLPRRLPESPKREKLPQKAREMIAVAEVEKVANESAAGDDISGPEDSWKWIPGLFGMPVEDQVPLRRCMPWITWGLTAALVAVFLLTLSNLEAAIWEFGLIPAKLWRYGGLTLLTAFFLHGGWMHLIGNSYFLVVFGDNVEDYLGRVKFVVLLLSAELLCAGLHALLDPRPGVPCVGASGGISGVIVFYACAFPNARLGILFWFWFVWRWLYIRAYVALILWFLLQGWLAYLQMSELSNVSALGHLGGAAAGLVAWLVWRREP